MSDEVILYDLPSKQGHCWSYNPWKTRLVLNYKSIPYKTEWTEYPDLKPKFEKFGIPPNETGTAYSSPTIRLPDGSYVMDSRRIADALERLHPNPPLHLDSPYQSRIESLIGQILTPIRAVFVPLVPKVFLNPASQAYFIPTREKAVGMGLEEFAKGADEGIQKASPFIRELGEMLRENEGPFLQGNTPCYADMMVLAWLRMLDRLGVSDRFFGLEGGQELKTLYDEGVKQGWFDRDSY